MGHAPAPGLLKKPRAPFAMVVQCPGRDGGPLRPEPDTQPVKAVPYPSGLRFVRVALKATGVEVVRQPGNAPPQLPPRPREQHKVVHVAGIKSVLLVQAGEVAVDVVQQRRPDERAQGAAARYAGHRRMYLAAVLHAVVRVLRHQVPAHRVADPVVYQADQRCFPDVGVIAPDVGTVHEGIPVAAQGRTHFPQAVAPALSPKVVTGVRPGQVVLNPQADPLQH